MTTGPRYAIYFAPDPASELWQFGSRVIGYDAASGREPPLLVPRGFSQERWRQLTDAPRRYGLHATLKAPFELARNAGEQDLLTAVRRLATMIGPVVAGRLEPRLVQSFVALVAANDPAALNDLATRVMLAFEPLRAPLSATDRARRLEAALSERQARYLDAYGYPHVREEFRFHVSLTGPLGEEERGLAMGGLARLCADAVSEAPVTVDALSVFRQASRAERFRIIGRYPISGP